MGIIPSGHGFAVFLFDVLKDVMESCGWRDPFTFARVHPEQTDPAFVFEARCTECDVVARWQITREGLRKDPSPRELLDDVEATLRRQMQVNLCPHVPFKGPGALAQAAVDEGGGL